MRSNKITRIKPGELVPSTPPRRYKDSGGYVILRWKVGVGVYVEALEHRVFDGRVTTAAQVHHRDENKANNTPKNLLPVGSWAEHAAEHRKIDRGRVVELYATGMTTTEVAAEVGTNHGNVWRIVDAAGVRRTGPLMLRRDIAKAAPEIVEALKAGVTCGTLARHYGCDPNVIGRMARLHGVPVRRQCGRPTAASIAAYHAWVGDHPNAAEAIGLHARSWDRPK